MGQLLLPGGGQLLLPGGGLLLLPGTGEPARRAVIVIISDAMVEAINGASLSQPVTAERKYLFIKDIRPVGTEVSIFPSVLTTTAADLGPRHSWEWQVAAWIRKRTTDIEEIDELMLLCEEIIELFDTKPLEGTRARCIGVEAHPPYDPTKIDTEGVFNAGLFFTFRLTK